MIYAVIVAFLVLLVAGPITAMALMDDRVDVGSEDGDD